MPRQHLVIIHLGALGAVLRSTSLLQSIKRKFPSSHITWVTQAPAQELLKNNSLIDRVFTTTFSDWLELQNFSFDVGFCIDKSLVATGIAKSLKIDLLYGFKSDEHGAIIPATEHANELWNLGLDNHQKFFVNQKSEQRLVHEALHLGEYVRDPYMLRLTPAEVAQAISRRGQWLKSPTPKDFILGINTGCSNAIPYKKLTVDYHRTLIQEIQKNFNCRVVLLGGGEEDETRNLEIAKGLSDVVVSPVMTGLRDGAASVDACDIVVTGDSLGMHMAIALGKWVVAWFGPTCSQEIDLYDNGGKVIAPVPCAPCWKRQCEKTLKCHDLVPVTAILRGIEAGVIRLARRHGHVLTEPSVGSGPVT